MKHLVVLLILYSFYHILECVQLLLAHGSPVKAKNLKGWSSLAEAISYGDRPTSKIYSLH